MRIVNYTINTQKVVQQVVQQPITITNEEFIRIVEDKSDRCITCSFNMYNGEFCVESTTIVIVGDKYELLMSESPQFALGKPANEYRESDLWHVIDLVRSEQ